MALMELYGFARRFDVPEDTKGKSLQLHMVLAGKHDTTSSWGADR